ncbi:phage terminase small subunit [Phytopseudomonas daroniae]|uniref:phage terminase small subunit n=1 Tax=Phytopseudomonas daroniae TaxID=2487519 RepID=UPI001038530F|nr:phage terminase small subunit [Pseudomonas daroniae]TBU70998.1 terminase [Pseudomonas daroniae]
MSNPCRRHFQRVTAALAAAAVAPQQSMEGANAYELQMAALHQDSLRLKQIQSISDKAKLKGELVVAYEPYVAGVLEAGQGAQDDVLTTVMTWRIDAGLYQPALEIARYVLQHKLEMPDRFRRKVGCYVAEEIATAALTALKAESPFDSAILLATEQLTRAQDMPDEARAKLHLALGRALVVEVPEKPTEEGIARLQTARTHLGRAIELHQSCGGKKDLERLASRLKKIAEAKPS